MIKLIHATSEAHKQDGMCEVSCGKCRSSLFYELASRGKQPFRLYQDIAGAFWGTSPSVKQAPSPVDGIVVCWACEKLSRMRELEGKSRGGLVIYDLATGEGSNSESTAA